MQVRVLLIQRRVIYLVIAFLCLVGGLSLAVTWKRVSFPIIGDLGGPTMLTSGGALDRGGQSAALPVAQTTAAPDLISAVAGTGATKPASTATANTARFEGSDEPALEPDIEKSLVSARVEYDYEGSALASARLSRDYTRSRELDLLRETLDRGEATVEAERRFLDLVARIDMESSAENLIRASGFDDAMVLLTDQTVEAIVSSDGLGKDDAAVIGGILSRVTGRKLHEIRIKEAV